jgi:tRNA A-37 threonylcarbamoyl transferase component Bud32
VFERMTGIYSLLEGKTLSGRYRVGTLISRGGMGAVFRGTDLHLDRPVAVKVIAIEPETPEQAEMLRARFRREARAAARLRHANVLTVHEFGTDAELGLDFIVMELLEGEDIQRRVRRAGPLPWKQASRILYEAARGLGAGHRAGLVHRDVKSANLFLEHGADGRPPRTRVLDFGIAQLRAEGTATATHLTLLGHAPLSPPYASPEQQRGERELMPAADVWGLGVTAFEMLTGTLPFTEEQRAALAGGARVEPPSVSRLNPAVPPAADALIRRALSPHPAERPRDGDAFAREISAIRRAQRAAETVRPAAPALPPLGGGDTVPGRAPAAAPPAPSRPVLLEPPPFTPSRPVLVEPPPLPPARVSAPVVRRSGGRVPAVVTIACIVLVVAVVVWRKLPERVAAATPATQTMVPVAPPDAHGRATEEQIGYIRRVYQRIENGTASFYQWRVDLGELGRQEWPYADSVYATAYEDGGIIQKFRVRVFQGGTRTSLLFYYDAGRLIFVHEVRQLPGSTVGLEQRYYFEGRTLIRWRDTNNAILFPNGNLYAPQAQTLLRISDSLLAWTEPGD